MHYGEDDFDLAYAPIDRSEFNQALDHIARLHKVAPQGSSERISAQNFLIMHRRFDTANARALTQDEVR